MPNSFQFINKTTGKADKFVEIDERLCAAMGVECHPTRYFRGWYDAFGFQAAIGKSFADMKLGYKEDIEAGDEMLGRMLDWFDENYTTSAWYSPK
jgi:hypothetical protein